MRDPERRPVPVAIWPPRPSSRIVHGSTASIRRAVPPRVPVLADAVPPRRLIADIGDQHSGTHERAPPMTTLRPLKVAMCWLRRSQPVSYNIAAYSSLQANRLACRAPGRSVQPLPRVVTASLGRYGRNFGASLGDLWRHAMARCIRTELKSVFKTTRHGPAWQSASRRRSLSKSGVVNSHRGFESHPLRHFRIPNRIGGPSSSPD